MVISPVDPVILWTCQGVNLRRCGSGYNHGLYPVFDGRVMYAGAVLVVGYDSFYVVYMAVHWLVVVFLVVRV